MIRPPSERDVVALGAHRTGPDSAPCPDCIAKDLEIARLRARLLFTVARLFARPETADGKVKP